MGGNGPSRFPEEEEGGGVTFVKGIRLSDRVINRMKHSSTVTCPHISPKPQTPVVTPVPPPSVEHLLPHLTPPPPQEAIPSPPPPVDASSPVKLIPPPPVKFHSLPPTSVEPAVPPPPVEPKTPPSVSAPSPPPSTASPVIETHTEPESPPPSPVLKPEGLTTPQTAGQVNEPVILPSSVEASPVAATPLESAASSPSPVETHQLSPENPQLESAIPPEASPQAETPLVEPLVPSALLEKVSPVEAAAADLMPPQPPPEPVAAPSKDPSLEETSSPCQGEVLSVIPTEKLVDEPVTPPPPDPVPPAEELIMSTSLPSFVEEESPVTTVLAAAGAASSVSPEAMEEELRQKIKAEMQKSLEEEMNQKKQELQQQLDELKVQTEAEAREAAQAQVEQQVKKTMEAEKVAHMEKLTESVAKERLKADNERLMIQLYWLELKAHQLEEKEKELKRRGALYQEQVTKIEARYAEFYRASAESFKKGKEETHNRFARFHVQPVCGDLQGQILKCYKENTGKTLTCSGIASAYMQCVDNAKKNKLTTGG